jgi:hypothetical protein
MHLAVIIFKICGLDFTYICCRYKRNMVTPRLPTAEIANIIKSLPLATCLGLIEAPAIETFEKGMAQDAGVEGYIAFRSMMARVRIGPLLAVTTEDLGIKESRTAVVALD